MIALQCLDKWLANMSYSARFYHRKQAVLLIHPAGLWLSRWCVLYMEVFNVSCTLGDPAAMSVYAATDFCPIRRWSRLLEGVAQLWLVDVGHGVAIWQGRGLSDVVDTEVSTSSVAQRIAVYRCEPPGDPVAL